MRHALAISDDLFARSCAERAALHAGHADSLADAEVSEAASLQELRRSGFTILRGLLAADEVASIRGRIDAMAALGQGLLCPRRVPTSLTPQSYETLPRIGADEVALGETHLRRIASMVQVKEPLRALPRLLPVALHPRILRIAGAHLGCWPALTYAKVRKSFTNDLPRCDTELFHTDGNATKLVKALLFLTDGEADPDAAHEVVTGTHGGACAHIDPFARFDRDEIVEVFGSDRVRRIPARAGDVVLEDTTGLHCAGKPANADRTIALFNYGVHPEYGGGGASVGIGREAWMALSREQRDAADLLTVG